MFYHAHIYYCPDTRASALRCHALLAESGLRLEAVGRPIDRCVGPHTSPMFEIVFRADQHAAVVRWLEEHRGEHSVLVHAVTEDEYLAHTREALWLGASRPLRLDKLG